MYWDDWIGGIWRLDIRMGPAYSHIVFSQQGGANTENDVPATTAIIETASL